LFCCTLLLATRHRKKATMAIMTARMKIMISSL
jgi:hypothetical protein